MSTIAIRKVAVAGGKGSAAAVVVAASIFPLIRD